MTLTTQDLKAIGEIVEANFKTQLTAGFTKHLKPIKRDIKAIRKDLYWVMGRYDTRLTHLEKHQIHPPGRVTD